MLRIKKEDEQLTVGELIDRFTKNDCRSSLDEVARRLYDLKDDKLTNDDVKIYHISNLLMKYEASMSDLDQKILYVLRSLQSTTELDFERLSPIVFGEKAKDVYLEVERWGTNLYVRATSLDVINLYDPKSLWHSLLNVPLDLSYEDLCPKNDVRHHKIDDDQLYDFRFVLPHLLQLVDKDFDDKFDSFRFVDSNCLAMTIAALSCNDDLIRATAYSILHTFMKNKLNLKWTPSMLTSSAFNPIQYQFVLRLFRDAIDKDNQRLSCVTSHFLARVTKLLLHPEDGTYASITGYLTHNNFDVDTVPEFIRLLQSTNVQNAARERHWILTLCAEALRTPNDFAILEKRHVFQLALMAYSSRWFDDKTSRTLVLKLIKRGLMMTMAAIVLLNKHALLAWIGSTATAATSFELGFLADLCRTLDRTMSMNEDWSYYKSDFDALNIKLNRLAVKRNVKIDLTYDEIVKKEESI